VATDGWSKMTGHDVVDLAKKFEDYGVEAVIYTDIGRDGMLSGVNIEATVKLAQALRIPVIASGGIASLKDVKALCAVEGEGIMGAITGRAIYEGTWISRRPRPRRTTATRQARRLTPPSACAARFARPMLAKRIIPCLDVTAGRVVKGVNFVELRDAGDPVEIAAPLRRAGRRRTHLPRHHRQFRRPRHHPAHRRGGGLAGVHPADRGRRRAPVEDVRRLLNAGADKVSMNTAAVANPQLVRDASAKVGAQCIVVAIDAKQLARLHQGPGLGGLHPRRAQEHRLDAVAWARRWKASAPAKSC
jgi:imidazole glycerol phosphate synthase subunit HisF